MDQVPLMCSVTKQQPVGGGQCSRRDWMAPLISTAAGTKTKNRLRVDLKDTIGKTAYAEYDMFAVTSEKTKYKLSLGSYSGKFSSFISVCC